LLKEAGIKNRGQSSRVAEVAVDVRVDAVGDKRFAACRSRGGRLKPMGACREAANRSQDFEFWEKLFQFPELVDLSAQSARSEGVYRTIDAAGLIKEKLVIGELVKSRAVRIAVLVGTYIDKGVDQQVELWGNAVIYQPPEKDAAKQMKVLEIGGDDLVVPVVIVVVGVLSYSRDAKHGQSDQHSGQRQWRDPRKYFLCDGSSGHGEVLSMEGLQGSSRENLKRGAQTTHAAPRFYTVRLIKTLKRLIMELTPIFMPGRCCCLRAYFRFSQSPKLVDFDCTLGE